MPVADDQDTHYTSVRLSDSIRSSNMLYSPYVCASLPTVGDISPDKVRRTTGAVITVHGSGFDTDHRCLFYPTAITTPMINSCWVPPSDALSGLASYSLQIVNSSGYVHPTDLADAVSISYIETPVIVSFAELCEEVPDADSPVGVALEVQNATEPITCIAI